MSCFTIFPPNQYNRIQATFARGAKPTSKNITFLELFQVNTLIALTPLSIYELESNDELNKIKKFIESNKINYLHFSTDSSAKDKGKNRGIPITHEQVSKILEIILRKNSGNIYMYCPNGGHITSLVIACLRKVQLWSNVSIFEEFICYSSSANHNDRKFVEDFPADLELFTKLNRVDWLWSGLNENVIMNHPSLRNIKFIQ